MAVALDINTVFTVLLICPLYYTGAQFSLITVFFYFVLVGKINERHLFLKRLIDIKPDEAISYENCNELVMVVSICLLVFTALETLFYFLFNCKVFNI